MIVGAMRKPIPPPSIDAVFPPNQGFLYYEHREDHPFQPRATTFSKVNAWWLAEAALLAYADADLASAAFVHAGLRLGGDQPFTGPSTQCYVAHNDDFVIVSFRGTQVIKPELEVPLPDVVRAVIRDVLADARVRLVDSTLGGRVHCGFKSALAEVWEDRVSPHLSRLHAERARPVWFTGHSLGAALATLAARSHSSAQGLYTFGSPRVGDRNFAATFRLENSYRFVNNNDLVTRVPVVDLLDPLGSPYKHVKHLKHIDSAGRIHDEVSVFSGALDSVFGHFDSALEFTANLEGLPVDALNDHAPLYYAIHTWNDLL